MTMPYGPNPWEQPAQNFNYIYTPSLEPIMRELQVIKDQLEFFQRQLKSVEDRLEKMQNGE